MDKRKELAGIEYSGIAGASRECQDAVVRLLQFGDQIVRARILSASAVHGLLLTVNSGDSVAIKSGFSSGYGGEGPTKFSYVLQLLDSNGAEIDECEVDKALIERLDQSALTAADIEAINVAKPIRPNRWHDYVLRKHFESSRDGTLWNDFPAVVPFAIVDRRIIDLAISFWEDPDDRLLKGYRRLEDIVRTRTSLDEHASKLWSQAFGSPTPRLGWKNIDDGERQGRINLFTGAYLAHRNPRAHRELKGRGSEQLSEFLLLNHLYLLEGQSHPLP